MKNLVPLLLIVFCATSANAWAQKSAPTVAQTNCPIKSSWAAFSARPLPHDPRLVVFPYDKNALYPINTYFNRFTHFEFEPGERIVASYINDETEWEMKVSATGSDIFVRPRVRGASGSMTTITDRRRYQIDLADISDCASEARYQRVSWSYQEGIYEDRDMLAAARGATPAASAGTPSPSGARDLPLPGMATTVPKVESAELKLNLASINSNYEIEGDADLAPTAVLDDGRRTILKFSAHMALRPVLFAISADGQAEAVEYVAADTHFLVNRLFEHGLQLKLGRKEVRIRNKSSSCAWLGCRVQGSNIVTQ